MELSGVKAESHYNRNKKKCLSLILKQNLDCNNGNNTPCCVKAKETI